MSQHWYPYRLFHNRYIVEQTWTPVGNLEEARLGTVSSPSSLLTMVQGSVGRLLEGTWTWHMKGEQCGHRG